MRGIVLGSELRGATIAPGPIVRERAQFKILRHGVKSGRRHETQLSAMADNCPEAAIRSRG